MLAYWQTGKYCILLYSLYCCLIIFVLGVNGLSYRFVHVNLTCRPYSLLARVTHSRTRPLALLPYYSSRVTTTPPANHLPFTGRLLLSFAMLARYGERPMVD